MNLVKIRYIIEKNEREAVAVPESSQQHRYLTQLSRQFPTIAAAASEIIRIEALLRLPKGTEHFMSDLHGANVALSQLS